MTVRPNRERIVWAALTVVLLTALALFVFSPRLRAASPEDETQQYLRDVANVFRYVRDNYVDADKSQPKALLEGALKGMLGSLGDPYSDYFAAGDTSILDDTTTGKYSGVGLVISKVDKGAEVVAPIEGSPAYKAGINAADVVVKVDGESMADYSIDDIMKKIRGQNGTAVTLSIVRGESMSFDVNIKRDVIEVPAVKWAMIGKDVGYLRLIQFTALAPERVRDALNWFASQGYKSLVIDLRGNPGGVLEAPIDIANYFISDGLIVGTHSDRDPARNQAEYADPKNMIVDSTLPVAVLVDKGSASASEILAGALKDTGRAELFGTTTYGKGSVQEVHRLSDTGGEFKLTIARYYTPSGDFIDKKGIVPNRVMEEPALSADQEKELAMLLGASQTAANSAADATGNAAPAPQSKGRTIQDFVKANPQPTDAQIAAFIADWRKQGVTLDDRYLRRLVRQEVNRTSNNPPIYDLDFDIVLQAAVKALQAGEITPKQIKPKPATPQLSLGGK